MGKRFVVISEALLGYEALGFARSIRGRLFFLRADPGKEARRRYHVVRRPEPGEHIQSHMVEVPESAVLRSIPREDKLPPVTELRKKI